MVLDVNLPPSGRINIIHLARDLLFLFGQGTDFSHTQY